MTKRIYRVYYDLPDHIVPKEVKKLFKLINKYMRLIDSKKHAPKKEIDRIEVETSEIESDIRLIAEVITPKNCNWRLDLWEKPNKSDFWVLTITEPVEESLFNKGQDDG